MCFVVTFCRRRGLAIENNHEIHETHEKRVLASLKLTGATVTEKRIELDRRSHLGLILMPPLPGLSLDRVQFRWLAPPATCRRRSAAERHRLMKHELRTEVRGTRRRFLLAELAIAVHFALALIFGTAAAAAGPASAAREVHAAPDGADTNSGAADSPLSTLELAVKRCPPAGAVVLHEGKYRVSRQIEITAKGVTIRPVPGKSVVLERGDYPGTVFTVIAEGVTIEGLTLDGRFASKSRAIKGKPSAGRLTVKNCEIRNFTDHAIDLDGADCRVEDCHIHHILFWDKAKNIREDAHGIVTMYSQRLLIRNCRIDHVSGDCFQGDRGAWQDVTLEGCDFSNGPLEADMGGFKKGASPGEDGIDTNDARDAFRVGDGPTAHP